ncbi:hypothetical protein GOBAR_DD11813 [Gossypium barbadense]|nr:hypothetical protein GOBAR_DD11813 [Gossypium barbadense]
MRAPKPHVPRTTYMLFAQTVGKGWQIRLGLGKDLQGISEPIFVPTHNDIRGLGYNPTMEDVKRMCKERKAKRLACIAGKKVVEPPLICPLLSNTFYSMGFEHQERTPVKLMTNGDAVDLNMIGDEVPVSRDWVCYNPSTLDNWPLIPLPAILMCSKM